ncbi:MAG: HNH endonuclease signature motif containing protein [Chloroflexi bacterium]|nr:HNH endonuclease signature motif containing protein [Chloroflexota bacterium]
MAYIPQTLRRQVAACAQDCCEYCHTCAKVNGGPLVIDHIQPESKGGTTILANLALACSRCNTHKAARTHYLDPFTGQQVTLFNPRLQNWSEHFRWDDTYTKIIGVTSHGRATILALNMNDPAIIVARTVWASGGWHPPHHL